MSDKDSTAHDHRNRRCPRLGHPVAFAYCRQPGSDTPCSKIFDCWFETFDVAEFMQAHYDAEIIQQILAPPKPKVASLIELIQQAQQAAKTRDA